MKYAGISFWIARACDKMVNTSLGAIPDHFTRMLGNLLADIRGKVTVFVAICAVPLMAAVGGATDGTRGYLINNKLQECIDIAALAAARRSDDSTHEATMLQYFRANLSNDFTGATVPNPTLNLLLNDQIPVTASVTVPNTFLQVIGVDTATISAIPVVKKEGRGKELILVKDNTESMRSVGKMQAMKDAAADLIHLLYESAESIENFRFNLVTYAAMASRRHDEQSRTGVGLAGNLAELARPVGA